MKRHILIITIGYIIGIIVGLYFEKSIVLLHIISILVFIINELIPKNLLKKNKGDFKLFSVKRYLRYIKLYSNKKTIILFLIIFSISSINIVLQNKKYEEIYNLLSTSENIELVGTVISNKIEKNYYYKYKVKTIYKNKKIKLYIIINKNKKINYGDKILFSGTYIKPEIQRNYNGFDYSNYLKQQKIYGTIKCNSCLVISNDNINKLFKLSNEISNRIKENIKKVLDDKTSSILLGIMLGDKEKIDEDILNNFKNAGIAHILAVSGMHISYIIIGINIIFIKLIGKRKTNFLTIFVLILYMFISDFSPSIVRAGIMGSLIIFSKIIYRKNDAYTSISLSLLVILIYNPFLIQNLGILLSYGGVIGIFLFNKTIILILSKIKIKSKLYKYKIRPIINKYIDKMKEIISISISVQTIILPIIFYNINTFNPFFLISNLILSIILGPIIIVAFIFIILLIVNVNFAKTISKIIRISIDILIFVSNIGKTSISKIYIPTPSLNSILIYYLFLIVYFFILNIFLSKKLNKTQIRIKNLYALIKIKLRKNKRKITIIIVLIILSIIILKVVPNRLRINFIDVGQGDCCFIVTPHNKTILIDGGGGENSDYDVGKNTLVPYILNRGFTKIDIIIVSHFDSDHVGGLLSVMEELKVKAVIISKQTEKSDNYEKFKDLVREKKIKVLIVEKGDKLKIEDNLYIDIIWPDNSKVISENKLNNNSIVCKLCYKNFSMIFTGDIEKIAEEKILQDYSNNLKILNSTILKVGHHGSKTSSIKEFIEIVNPKIALIGVGKNNRFGHPNDEVIERLEDVGSKIYRTDEMGEISITVNINGKIRIKKFIE